MRKIATLSDRFDCEPPATNLHIARCELDLGFGLPNAYRKFLMLSNGGRGFIGKGSVIFWAIEDLCPLHEVYGIEGSCPGLLIFGTSGDRMQSYGFDTRIRWWQFPVVKLGPEFAWDLARPPGKSFSDFLKRLSEQKYE